MAISYQRFFVHETSYLRTIRAFFQDRFLKIFPVYWIVLAVTYLLTTTLGSEYISWAWVNSPDTMGSVFRNIVILPLNYFMAPYGLGPVEIPAAWSLGTEIQFYLLVPVIWLAMRNRLGPLVVSVAVVSAAFIVINLGYDDPTYVLRGWIVLHQDYGAYRPIWSVFVLFVVGFLIAEANANRDKTGNAGSLLIALTFIFGGYTAYQLLLGNAFSKLMPRSMIIGILIFLPISYVLLKTMGSDKFKPIAKIDRFFGSLSYPFFLVHMPSMLVAEHLLAFGEMGLDIRLNYWLYAATSALIAFFASILLSFVAERIESMRISIRGFASLKTPR